MNKTRAEYPSLEAISKTFATESKSVGTQIQTLRRHVEIMRGGAWVGKAAVAFLAEMDDVVLPSVQRLQRALESASRATRELSTTIKSTEEEAARVLNGSGAGEAGSGSGTGTGSDGSTTGSGSGETGSGSGGGNLASPATGSSGNSLVARDPAEVFSEGNLKTLVGKTYDGAGTPELRQAMETIWKNRDNPDSPAVQDALKQIAESRGVPLERIQADFNKYQQLLAEQRASGQPPAEGLNDRNAGFMGKTGQLRYGDVVGQVFGVDPVFGALLNPTGGLVGPGNAALDLGDTAVAYHGAVHDAGGYLYNNHNTGPGYDYLGREGRDTSSPYSGQQAGIDYWRDTLGNDAASVTAQVIAGIGVPVLDAGQTLWQGAKDIGSAGSNAYRNIREGDWGGLASDAGSDLSNMAGNFRDGAVQTAKDTWRSVETNGEILLDAAGEVLTSPLRIGKGLLDKLW